MSNATQISRDIPSGILCDGAVDRLPKILPHHLLEFRRSGLTDATITKAGLYSETDPVKLAGLLDHRKPRKLLAPAIVFPFTGADGKNGYCRIKPDVPRKLAGKPVKYESPRGQPNRSYIPPSVAEVLSRPEAELMFTEGEKKALAATQAGFPCIGLVGSYGWKDKHGEHMLAELERIEWHGRPVLIAFDSDILRKPDVQKGESRLAKHLTDRGARVRCIRFPDGPLDETGHPSKMGLDDFLVAHGAAELRKLADGAIEPEPLEGKDGKEDAGKIDPGTEAKKYLETLMADGLPRLRFWRGSGYLFSNGAYRELDDSEVRADLLRHLDHDYCRLGSGTVSCVLDHVRAHAILRAIVQPGDWIGEPIAGWKAHEILSTRKAIIHLPSLVAGGDAARPATPRLFSTAALDFDFDMNAPVPEVWLNFISQLWPDDPDAIGALQEWIGYLLTPDTRQQKILLLCGPKRSGKGTIGRIVRELVGQQNVAGPTLASLATNFGLSPLIGRSAAIISDARLSGRTDSAVVIERLLSISGEDALTVDRKHREQITCKLSTRLMLLTNELPRLSDASGALASRFIVLRLRESFYGREDHGLTDKLLGELPGILLWAIEGWRRLRDRGYFVQPESGQELAGEMEDLTSPVGAFIRERCVVGPVHQAPVDDIFTAWKSWCEDNGRKEAGTTQTFGRDLSAAVPSLRRARPREDGERVRVYEGIGLQTLG